MQGEPVRLDRVGQRPPHPDGVGTTLRFRHYDLPTAESAASHAHGWDHYLPRLVIAAEGGIAEPDPWATST